MQDQADIKFVPEVVPDSVNSAPWISKKSQAITNPIIRFHNQIIDFVQFISPKQSEHETKQNIFNEFKDLITSIVNSLEVKTHKKNKIQIVSPLFSTKFYLQNTELEIFVIVPEFKDQTIINIIDKIQKKEDFKFYNSSTQKKLEQVRYVLQHLPSKTMIWINFVSQNWASYLSDIQQIINSTPELRYLYFINWCIIRQRGLHFSIRSTLIFGICSFFMFERRKQKARTLTENVIKFLEFFGIGSTHQRRISYKNSLLYECVLIPQQKGFKFFICPKLDISSPKVRQLFKVIQNRYRIIGNFYYAPGISILAHLVNPCLGNFYY